MSDVLRSKLATRPVCEWCDARPATRKHKEVVGEKEWLAPGEYEPLIWATALLCAECYKELNHEEE